MTKAAAALFNKYSFDHDFPILTLFRTLTPSDSATEDKSKNRAYVARTAILLDLSQGDSYEYAMMRKTGLGQAILGEHFGILKDAGYISYESADMETKGWGIYERIGTPEQVTHSTSLNRLRRNILKYFESNTVGNPQTITQAIDRVDELGVFRVLSELTEDGFLKRAKWHGGVQQSEAKIKDSGRELLSEVLVPVLKACAGDPAQLQYLAEVREYAQGHPEIAAKVIKLYREATVKTPRWETKDAILDIIATKGPARTQQIIDQLGKRSEPVLSELFRSGKLVKYEVGKASYHMLPGMKPPKHRGGIIVFQYTPPESLLPPTCFSKEKYAAELETKNFWERMLTDLQKLPVGVVPERVFFNDYDPENPHWQEKDDYQAGRYMNHTLALRRFGIRNPYRFLKNYQTNSGNAEVSGIINQAQQMMREKLIETRQVKHWGDYYEEFHTEQFWQDLIADMEQAPKGGSFFQFLAFFSDSSPADYSTEYGKYYNVYVMASKHSSSGAAYLRDFKPTLPHSPQLDDLINKARQLMRDKFIFSTQRRSPEKWAEVLTDPLFWEEFEKDVNQCPDAETFLNFLLYYDQNNSDLALKREADGKMHLGKYYLLVTSTAPRAAMHLQLPDFEDWPPEFRTSLNSIARPYIYSSAPPTLREALLRKFPAEFRPIAKARASVMAKKEFLPTDVTAQEEAYATQLLLLTQTNHTQDPEKVAVQNTFNKKLSVAVENFSISPRQAAMVRARFGLAGQQALNLKETAIHFGLTDGRVVELVADALQSLQTLQAPDKTTQVVLSPTDIEESFEIVDLEWNLPAEIENSIHSARDPEAAYILEKIHDLHNPKEWRAASAWDIDKLEALALKLPIRGDRVNFGQLEVSPYIAAIVDFITAVEFNSAKGFKPKGVVVYSIFKEDLLACVELLGKSKQKMNLGELFRKEVQKAIKILTTQA